MTDKKTQILANRIAASFRKPNENGACACIGPSNCSNLKCYSVWEYLLENGNELSSALDHYRGTREIFDDYYRKLYK